MIKRLINRFTTLTALLAVVIGVSCSKDAVPEPGNKVICISSSIASVSQSKGISLSAEAQSGIALLRKDASTTTAPTSFADATLITANRTASGDLTFLTQQLYNTNNDYAHYVAFYPAGTASPGNTEFQISDGGKTDLLLTETVWSAGCYSNPVSLGMTFEHQLAQLQVICTAASDASLPLVHSTWGKITKIEIMETATTALLNHTTLNLSFSGSASLLLSAADCEAAFQSVTLAKNTVTPSAGGMFAPNNSGTAPLKLKVYTETETSGKEVSVQLQQNTTAKGFAKGMTHTVTLTFGIKDKDIAVSATSIDAWVVGGTGSGDNITSNPIRIGVLDMTRPNGDLITNGMLGVPFNALPTTASYNNLDKNGGIKTTLAATAVSEPVYCKLEIAKADEQLPLTWITAWDACKAKSPAGAWRLPRLSELALIFLNRTELNKSLGFTPLLIEGPNSTSYYVSDTKSSESGMWVIMNAKNFGYSGRDVTGFNARCVRELAL